MAVGLRKALPRVSDGTVQPKDVKFRCSFHNTIYDVFKGRGFTETDAELDWDIFWCDKEWIHDVFDHVHLKAHQRLNHFRNHYELTRKDLLVKNLKRAQRQAQKDGLVEDAKGYADCSPTTFSLPTEYSIFVEEFKKKQSSGAIWIMKPVGMSQGKGIFLFDKLSQVSGWRSSPQWTRKSEDDGAKRPGPGDDGGEASKKEIEPYVVQHYLADPLLIGGKKFDLRLYVLVTSYAPLVVYTYRSGFARFSHARFTMDRANLENAMVHLTNVAVQKHNENYDEQKGGKWDLHHLKQYLIVQNSPEKVDELFCAINDVILYSLKAVQKVMIQDKHCFELYGYDIMISNDLKPWLIEVNASPSLTANTPNDYEMKYVLLDDMLAVLDLERNLEGNETSIGGFDLLHRGGAQVGPQPGAMCRSFLGCSNERLDKQGRLRPSPDARFERLRRMPGRQPRFTMVEQPAPSGTEQPAAAGRRPKSRDTTARRNAGSASAR